MGNRTALTTTEGTTTYQYDAANRLTSVNGVTYTWDARGNLTNDGTFTYIYNSAGRMVRAESITSTLVYTYSADGLRVAQSVDGDVTTFAWDWASGIPEMLAQSPNPQSPNPQFLYLVGHETLGRWDGATWAYHLPDALGSVRQVVDGAGAVVSAREWTPYGVEVGAGQAGLGYTGEWWDADVGLEYLRARWYDVGTGRFTTEDPAPGYARIPRSLHIYVYAWNNPVNLNDPTGLQVQPPDDCEPGEICYTGTSGPYVVPPPPPAQVSYADLLADPEKRRRWCAQETTRSINEAILSGPRDYFDLTWKSIDNSLYSSLCCSESLPAYEEAFLNADPLGREVAGPKLLDSGIVGFTVPTLRRVNISAKSRLKAALTLHEHGIRMSVSDWYDTGGFRWPTHLVGTWTNDFTMSRIVRVDTSIGRVDGPHFLGKVAGSQEGEGSLWYSLQYSSPERPTKITMELHFGRPAYSYRYYSLQIPHPHLLFRLGY